MREGRPNFLGVGAEESPVQLTRSGAAQGQLAKKTVRALGQQRKGVPVIAPRGDIGLNIGLVVEAASSNAAGQEIDRKLACPSQRINVRAERPRAQQLYIEAGRARPRQRSIRRLYPIGEGGNAPIDRGASIDLALPDPCPHETGLTCGCACRGQREELGRIARNELVGRDCAVRLRRVDVAWTESAAARAVRDSPGAVSGVVGDRERQG